MRPDIILDLSRLLSRVLHMTPTGVDRVEMAYARGLDATAGGRLSFAAVHPVGLYGRLPRNAVMRFLDRTEARWEHVGADTPATLRRSAAESLWQLRPRAVPARGAGGARVYVQASPHHLTRPRVVERILRREDARLVCLVHDLIPLEYPEYARANGADEHRVRIETILQHAAGIVANSDATLAALRGWAARNRLPVKAVTAVAHLGTHDYPAPGAAGVRIGRDARPYFVSIGTIEPRKNHLLLLNLWRRMAEEAGADRVPRLVLIGRRGWENEQIVDMLERCPALVGCVEERNGLSDRETRAILSGARALLMPSFAEGYGMPITEALDLGVPVICSDLPALHEAGGVVPLFLDPLDGPAWRRAIETYADPGDPARAVQLDRLSQWSRPDWRGHIMKLDTLMEAVAR